MAIMGRQAYECGAVVPLQLLGKLNKSRSQSGWETISEDDWEYCDGETLQLGGSDSDSGPGGNAPCTVRKFSHFARCLAGVTLCLWERSKSRDLDKKGSNFLVGVGGGGGVGLSVTQ